jgi:hypothetical protein
MFEPRPQATLPTLGAASALLQELHDCAPAGHFTLEWLTTSLRKQSYGAMIFLLAILAAAPGISMAAGLLLLVPTVQMIAGRPAPKFPRWIARRPLPTEKLRAALARAIPVLKAVETAFHPRWPMPPIATSRIVGLITMSLTARLIIMPLPLSNILPAALIALLSLAYLEQDGVMLTVVLLAGLIVAALDTAALWSLIHGAAVLT